MGPPSVYIRVRRLAEVGATGLLVGPRERRDRIDLIMPDGEIGTRAGLSVATHTERDAAPTIDAGWHPDVWCPGLHRGRPGLVQQGPEPLTWTRAGRAESGWSGLNVHSWRGRSDGCITAPEWWVEAVLAACDALAQSGDWSPTRHPDGRWCIGVLIEPAGHHIA